MEAACGSWDRGWSRAADRLRECLSQVQSILRAYDPLLATSATPKEVTARLTRAQRETLELEMAEEAVAWVEQNWPSPAERVEARFALWEIGSGAGTP